MPAKPDFIILGPAQGTDHKPLQVQVQTEHFLTCSRCCIYNRRTDAELVVLVLYYRRNYGRWPSMQQFQFVSLCCIYNKAAKPKSHLPRKSGIHATRWSRAGGNRESGQPSMESRVPRVCHAHGTQPRRMTNRRGDTSKNRHAPLKRLK